MKKYDIIRESTRENLIKEVNFRLQAGWRLIGQPFATPEPANPYDRYWYQAVMLTISDHGDII
jgi:Domain of unknown function (DUF1737)